jgi:phosphomannomutase
VEIAIISGGDWPQFQAQLVGHLPEDMPWVRLHLLPTSGAERYRFEGGK